MDYFSQKVLAVMNIVVADLRDIADKISVLRKGIEQQGNPKATAHKSEEKQQNELPVAIEVKFEKNQERERKTEADRQYRVQNSIRKATWGAFAAATLYAGIAAYQSWQLKEQFQSDQRPRIAILSFQPIDMKTPPPSEPIVGDPVAVNIYYRNVGKSPALNIAIHRHLLFESKGDQFKIEAPEKSRNIGQALDPGMPPDFTTAFSLKDTFANESVAINPSDIINWDGSRLLVFGRISYEDSLGNLYCTPYMVLKLTAPGGWLYLGELNRGPNLPRYKVADLCPTGKY
jgi:hypothetical protein